MELQVKLEEKIISYCLTDKKYMSQVYAKVKPEYLTKLNVIFTAICKIYQQTKGVVSKETIEIYFKQNGYTQDDYVKLSILASSLDDYSFSMADLELTIDQLIIEKKKRDYVKIAEMIVDTNPHRASSTKIEELQQEVYKKMVDIKGLSNDTRAEGFVSENVKSRWERYLEIEKNPHLINAIPTGFESIDKKNIGFRKSELVYIVGRKGHGKSVALLNFGYSAWVAGHNVIIFTLEISKEDYERRFDSRAAKVNVGNLKTGKLEPKERKQYIEYLKSCEKQEYVLNHGEVIKTGNIYIVDCPSGCTPAFIDSKIEELERYHEIKFDVVITDYAGIMRSSSDVQEKRNQQGEIALELKRIARERECVVISAAQANRESTKNKQTAMNTAVIAESDQIADHCDWVIVLKLNDENTKVGKMYSVKTRDAEPFSFLFTNNYQHMEITEDFSIADWEVEEEKEKENKKNKKGEW